MYNLVKDEYDSNIDDIIASVNKMINKTPSKIKKGKLFVKMGQMVVENKLSLKNYKKD